MNMIGLISPSSLPLNSCKPKTRWLQTSISLLRAPGEAGGGKPSISSILRWHLMPIHAWIYDDICIYAYIMIMDQNVYRFTLPLYITLHHFASLCITFITLHHFTSLYITLHLSLSLISQVLDQVTLDSLDSLQETYWMFNYSKRQCWWFPQHGNSGWFAKENHPDPLLACRLEGLKLRCWNRRPREFALYYNNRSAGPSISCQYGPICMYFTYAWRYIYIYRERVIYI